MQKGMSLVELLVILAILGVLTSIAVPWFQLQQLKAYRSAGQTELLNYANMQVEFMLERGEYVDSEELDMRATQRFSFEVLTHERNRFTLQATARNMQTADTGCETMWIDQSMVRRPAECW